MSEASDVRQRLHRHLARKPDISAALFVAPNATVVGDVVLGDRSSVFYGSVLRGDINEIRIGEGTNIQDNVVVHLADAFGVRVGSWCTVGHRAILHACRVDDECLIGMGSTVLDGAHIGARSIVGAGTLVTQGMEVPPGSLVYGSPARIVRPLSGEEQRDLRHWAEKYLEVAREHAERQGAS